MSGSMTEGYDPKSDKAKVKIQIMAIIHAVVYISFGVIILVNVMAITFLYIDYAQGRFEIQKRDAMISALILSGKVDSFIVQTHPDQQATE